MKYKTIFTIIVIIFLAVLTRFVRLDYSPPHLSNDEISIAYDAYSISKTLRDSHNHFLPLSFQSHNTYKAPLAIYLTIPTIVILGNTDYSARLPSAILGSLTVLILGLLIYELSKNRTLAILSSFILTITPWHIYTSRMLLEANIALFFVTLGVYLFFYGLSRQKAFVILGSYLAFALSLYSYHTEWGFTPMLLLVIGLLYRKVLFKRVVSFLGIGLFLLLLVPLFIDFLHNLNTSARANTEIFFKDPSVAEQLSNQALNVFQKGQVVVKAILGNYSSYTNPGHIFFNGLGLLPPLDPFQIGLFLSPFLPCFVIGLFNIKKYFEKNTKFIYCWLFIAPVIPALTWGEVSNVRSLVLVIPYTIVIAAGTMTVWSYLKNHRFLKLGAIGLLLVSFIYFLAIYYYHFPFENGISFQYGYKQIAEYIKPRYNQYEKIIIDPRFGDWNIYFGVPTSYIPYYTKLDPRQLQKSQDTPNGVFFDKYEIRDINWNLEKPKHSYLYVVPVYNAATSKELKQLIQIKLPNRFPAFNLYTY